jgi:hypothetical protein
MRPNMFANSINISIVLIARVFSGINHLYVCYCFIKRAWYTYIVLYEILVLHNIRLRCYCNTFMCSTNNGMRSLAGGLYVIRARSESPRLLFQLLPTWKRDFAHGISTRMCNLTCTRRECKQVNMSIETNIARQVCWECYHSENPEGSINRWECPGNLNAPVNVVFWIPNCYQSQNSGRSTKPMNLSLQTESCC